MRPATPSCRRAVRACTGRPTCRVAVNRIWQDIPQAVTFIPRLSRLRLPLTPWGRSLGPAKVTTRSSRTTRTALGTRRQLLLVRTRLLPTHISHRLKSRVTGLPTRMAILRRPSTPTATNTDLTTHLGTAPHTDSILQSTRPPHYLLTPMDRPCSAPIAGLSMVTTTPHLSLAASMTTATTTPAAPPEDTTFGQCVPSRVTRTTAFVVQRRPLVSDSAVLMINKTELELVRACSLQVTDVSNTMVRKLLVRKANKVPPPPPHPLHTPDMGYL